MTENNNKKRILNRDIWVEITDVKGKINVIYSEISNLCKKIEKYDEIVNKRIDATKLELKTQYTDVNEKLENKIGKGTFITISIILGIIMAFATISNFFIK